MPKVRRPRHGSLQFWPRKRAKRAYAKVKSWINTKTPTVQGFAGYKAGMTHITLKDMRSHSITKGEIIVWPVTVIECPSMKPISLRLYKKTPYGLKIISEAITPKLDKELAKKINMPKKDFNIDEKLKELESKLGETAEIRLLVHTQPKKIGIGKKVPEIFELGIGGDVKTGFEYAKGLFNKEIKVSEVLKSGTKVDVHAVTKGKGFQGAVKRFGIHLRAHKAEKKRRGNNFGPIHPAHIHWGVPAPGKMGYHLRTEHNKEILLVSDKIEKINPKGGFMHYGEIKSEYVLKKGSVPGAVKRLITITEPLRHAKPMGTNYEIQYISQESKQ